MTRKAFYLPLLFVFAGCAPAAKEASEAKVTVKPGTEVNAVLMKELSSGGSPEGEEVPMMVSEDVRDSAGHILIAKGTPLVGKVTWSRSEGSLGALTNQPARLNFKFDFVDAADGTDLKLSADDDEAKDYELNRDNTGKLEPSQQLEKLASDSSNDQVLEAVHELFEKGETSKLDSPETRDKLAAMAQEMGLTSTNRLIQHNEVSKVNDLVKQLRQGGTVAALASGGSTAVIDAALELAGVAGQVGNRLSKMVGGRNIRAYVGTPVKGYVIESATVTIKG